jgi:hypothetical protein
MVVKDTIRSTENNISDTNKTTNTRSYNDEFNCLNPHCGRADFWRGFIFGHFNLLVLISFVYLIRWLVKAFI